MRTWARIVGELLLVIVAVPQAFLFFYFFPQWVTGTGVAGLLKSVSLYALTISWVSAPVLVALSLLVRLLIRRRLHWVVTLLLCLTAGYLWMTAWNLLVYPFFAYGRATLPLVLCALGTAGYAMARKLYLDSLPAPQAGSGKSGESNAGGLPE